MFRPELKVITSGLYEGLGHLRTFAAEHVVIRNCNLGNRNEGATSTSYAGHILIASNPFDHLRPTNPSPSEGAYDGDAIHVTYVGTHIRFSHSRFENISSDGSWTHRIP